MITRTLYVDGGITHPCGHEASFDDSCLKTDHFRCPHCGIEWHMHQAPPKQHPSGWVEPGKRTLILAPQLNLALTSA